MTLGSLHVGHTQTYRKRIMRSRAYSDGIEFSTKDALKSQSEYRKYRHFTLLKWLYMECGDVGDKCTICIEGIYNWRLETGSSLWRGGSLILIYLFMKRK